MRRAVVGLALPDDPAVTTAVAAIASARDTYVDPAVRDFLAHGTRTGELGWTAGDGRPLVAPTWFLAAPDMTT